MKRKIILLVILSIIFTAAGIWAEKNKKTGKQELVNYLGKNRKKPGDYVIGKFDKKPSDLIDVTRRGADFAKRYPYLK